MSKVHLSQEGRYEFGDNWSEGSQYIGDFGEESIATMAAQQQANDTNIALAKQTNDFNLQMWNLENEYNDPSNQVKRLMDAGINPNSLANNGNATSQVTGTTAQVGAPTIDQNQSTNRFNAQVNAFQSALSELRGVFQQGVELKKVGIENDRLDIQRKDLESQIGLRSAQTTSQNQQNSVFDQNNKNSQVLIKAQIDKTLAETNLTNVNTATAKSSLEWMNKFKPYELRQIQAEINKTIEETKGIVSENAVHALRARLANLNINPDSHGADKFWDLFVTQPNEIGSLFNKVVDGFGQSFNDIRDRWFNDLDIKLKDYTKELLKSMPQRLLMGPNNSSHRNPEPHDGIEGW